MSTPPVLTLDLPSAPSALPTLRELAPALDAAGLGGLSVSGDAEAGDLHPIHVASHLAPLTRALAVLVRTDAIDVEPFHLATQLMSLDHISHGRAGWLVEARSDDAAAQAVGREALDDAAREQEAADVLAASRLLWDSWTDDAVVRDISTGVFVDAARLQYADFEGQSFSVKGPSITPRSPQGQLPVLVADADRQSVGAAVAEQGADGRAIDVRVDVEATAQDIAGAVREALGAATAQQADAPGRTPRVVRLIGLVEAGAEAETAAPAALAARLADAAAQLRADDLIAPAPASGASLRDQLGLPRPEVTIDPARRSDRARTSPEETAA
ncbi:LLM class flavin-dependent oxidoreductase [Brachybacterium endophyticum]|uniref:LLM class flavin-dependent oxidoreductase n=1 Tax=Brachybacterium endophyticum TaxID=2182385 RepID=A0A2U2RHW9_9MICO|nr:LLM class flavin-dependent oxidoreductase [Brachybacterium endophyticum]PWH05472.1 LLM class flavin-dependent oxidoreductase [Brachybacterium endophyticum]